jgi:hypothetical protein
LGAPWDGSVECCDGLAPVGGLCREIDACVNYPCQANSNCSDLPAPAPDDPSGRTCHCVAGYADCNGEPSDGCEVDLAANDANCGACGVACQGLCANGSCIICGDGECSVGAESCVNCARDCGTCPAPACGGVGGQWNACRGSGCAVCAEFLNEAVYTRYFLNVSSRLGASLTMG